MGIEILKADRRTKVSPALVPGLISGGKAGGEMRRRLAGQGAQGLMQTDCPTPRRFSVTDRPVARTEHLKAAWPIWIG